MPVRGMHFCFQKGHRPTFEKLKDLLNRLSDLKQNTLLVEYDDSFPWGKNSTISHPEVLTRDEVNEFVDLAKQRFIQIIPLVNSFGHAESYLKHDKYAPLREVPERIDEMCPLKTETMNFVKELWEDMFESHPDCQFAHIGGDEVFRKRDFCPECRKYADNDRLAELYTKYYSELAEWVVEKGRTPMVWGDMLIKYAEDLDNFPKNVVICDWSYHSPDQDHWDNVQWLIRPGRKKRPEKDRNCSVHLLKES